MVPVHSIPGEFNTIPFVFVFNVVLFKNVEFCQKYADKREHRVNKTY